LQHNPVADLPPPATTTTSAPQGLGHNSPRQQAHVTVKRELQILLYNNLKWRLISCSRVVCFCIVHSELCVTLAMKPGRGVQALLTDETFYLSIHPSIHLSVCIEYNGYNGSKVTDQKMDQKYFTLLYKKKKIHFNCCFF